MSWLDLARPALVVVLGLMVVLLGGRIVDAVFRVADRSTGRTLSPGGQDPTAEEAPRVQAAATQLRGGAWIGMLERLAIYATLLAGYPEGMAVALGLKGLARYPELKATHTGAAERFIIGTFVSVLQAVAVAGLAWWLLELL